MVFLAKLSLVTISLFLLWGTTPYAQGFSNHYGIPQDFQKIVRNGLHKENLSDCWPCQPPLLKINADSPDIGMGISEDEDSKILPNPPGNITVSNSGQNSVIQWSGTGLSIVHFYYVYEKCGGGHWVLIEKVKSRGSNTELYQLTTNKKESCHYSIAAVDAYGNEGQKSKN